MARKSAGVIRYDAIPGASLQTLARRKWHLHRNHVHVFREGYYPGWANDFKWPLALTASDLASRFVAPFISYISDPAPRASEVIQNAARVIVDRWQALSLTESESRTRGTTRLW